MSDPIHCTAVEVASGETTAEELAAMAFLAGYTTRTRESYGIDLRRWFAFCDATGIRPFGVRRAHIELFAREMETKGLAVATVARRLSTVCVWYRYLYAEEFIDRDPATFVRRPKVSMESTTLGLDRAQLGTVLYTAERARPAEYACAAEITDLGMERGHRNASLTRSPLRPRRAIRDAQDPRQGQQTGAHSSRTPYRPGRRPRHRRAPQWPHHPRQQGEAVQPTLSCVDGREAGPPGSDRSPRHPAQPAPRICNRRSRRRGATA